MHFLILHMLAVVVFLQLLRYTQRRGDDILSVVAFNYAAAAVLSAIFYLCVFGVKAELQPAAIMLGATNGVLYYLHLLILLACFRVVGTGISIAVCNSASIAPIVVASVLWPQHETMNALRWLAVALIPPAMILMRPMQGKHGPIGFRGDVLLAMAFIMGGLIMIIHKVGVVLDDVPLRAAYQYQMSLFAFAMISSIFCWMWRRYKLASHEIRWGILVGACNVTATGLLLAAVTALGAVMFYSTASPMIIVLTLIVAWILWKERINKRQVAGVAMAILIVVLTNLK